MKSLISSVPPIVRPREEVVSVLVVDDRADNRRALAAMLGGYRIVEAASGPEALRRLLDEDFAVVLVDVVMPEMSGFELATIMKERERTAVTPIVFLTAQASDIQLVYKGYRAGAVDYLVKPLVPEMVRAKVSVFAELHRQRLRIERQAELLLKAEKQESEIHLLELRLSAERHFQSLADAMPQIVWVARPDGSVEYFNRRWFEYTGRSSDERSRSLQLAIHPEDLASWEESRRSADETSETRETAVRLRAANGAYRWHLARAIPERGNDGSVVAWIGTFTDIEEQKRAEHDKAQAYEEAAAAVRARDEFLSIASHELRTPVSSIQLQVEMLQSTDPLPSPEQVRKKLETTSRQVRRLSRLITELLEVSRITTGHLTLDREELDLSLLAHEVATRLEAEASRAGCEIVVRADKAVVGKWDRFRLDQVVTNLLTNALKFGEKKPIELHVAEESGHGRLMVRDHGIGIAPEDVERIFQRFEQAVSGRSYGGLGLGLFIVRQITDAHGGVVRVESEKGAGSMFIIELPREPQPAGEGRPV